MNNDQLLNQIGNLIDQKLAPIKEDIKALYKGQKDIRKTMATKEDITEIKEDIAEIKMIQLKQGADIRIMKEDVKTVELKVAVIQEQNNRDHTEMMDLLIEGNEINYKTVNQDIKKLE